MKGTQLVVLASDHHVIDISDGASKVVAWVGCLPGMPNHLHGIRARLRSKHCPHCIGSRLEVS